MTGLYLVGVICAVVVIWVVVLLKFPPVDQTEPARSNADWFQTLPWRDFTPGVPRLRRPRPFTPKRRGRHAA